MSVRIDISQKSGVKGAIAKIAKKVGSPEPALRIIGQTIVDDIVLPAFDDQRSPNGDKWAPLKPRTLQSIVPGTRENLGSAPAGTPPGAGGRRRWTYSTLALVRRRHLRASFDHQIVEGGTAVSIGTPFAFFKYHQQAPDAPPGKGIIPKRAALPELTPTGRLPAATMKIINDTLTDYLDELGGDA